MEKEITFGNFRYAYVRTEDPLKQDFARHMHNLYEIIFIVDGNHEYVVDNKKFVFKPFDLLIVPPKKFHFVNILPHSPYERHVLNFNEDGLPQYLLNKIFNKSKQFSFTKDNDVVRIFNTFADYSERFGPQERILAAQSLLLELLVILYDIKEHDTKEYIYYDPLLSRILNYIDLNLNSIECVDQIAGDLFISKSYLFYYFKKTMGITLMQFINNKRVMHAQSLLKTGQHPTKIYEKCGFKDYSSFYRSYCKIIGFPPSQSYGSREKQ